MRASPCPTCGQPPQQTTGWPCYFSRLVNCGDCYEPGRPIGWSDTSMTAAIEDWNAKAEGKDPK